MAMRLIGEKKKEADWCLHYRCDDHSFTPSLRVSLLRSLPAFESLSRSLSLFISHSLSLYLSLSLQGQYFESSARLLAARTGEKKEIFTSMLAGLFTAIYLGMQFCVVGRLNLSG